VTGRFTTGTSQKIYILSSKEGDYREGEYNNALRLSSYLGEYVTIDKSRNFTFNAFTISFWLKRAAWFHNSASILSFLDTHSTAGWTFNLLDNGSQARFGVANGSGFLTYPKSVLVNSSRYDNLIGTFDGSTISLYVNGKIYDKVSYSGRYYSPDLEIRIGSQAYKNGNSFYGRIDDLRIYDGALNASEISALYQNYSTSPSKNLIGHSAEAPPLPPLALPPLPPELTPPAPPLPPLPPSASISAFFVFFLLLCLLYFFFASAI
jgi:hypothetical protein